eukprot:m.737078 g.737078  ORF g.737078 m.737078 type:complete len:821 (+) comp58903_c0_seq6:757-3219(+)
MMAAKSGAVHCGPHTMVRRSDDLLPADSNDLSALREVARVGREAQVPHVVLKGESSPPQVGIWCCPLRRFVHGGALSRSHLAALESLVGNECCLLLLLSMGKGKKSNSKLEEALWTAEHSSTEVIDISECEIKELPDALTTLCAFNKKTLLAHSNVIKRLPPDVSFLSRLLVLDLHNNVLKELPDSIAALTELIVLNVDQNRLKALPDSIRALRNLQTLTARGNGLTGLPVGVGQLRELKILDVADNMLHQLPKELARCPAIRSIIISGNPCTFPPPEIASRSTEEIMFFLCQASGVPYVEPVNDSAIAPKPKTPPQPIRNTFREQEQKQIEEALRERDRKKQEELETMQSIRNEQEAMRERILRAQEAALLERADFTDTYVKAQREREVQTIAALDAKAREQDELSTTVRRQQIIDSQHIARMVHDFDAMRNSPQLLAQLANEYQTVNRELLQMAIVQEAQRKAALQVLAQEKQRAETAVRAHLSVKTRGRTEVIEQVLQYQTIVNSFVSSCIEDMSKARLLSDEAVEAEARRAEDLICHVQSSRFSEREQIIDEYKSLHQRLHDLSMRDMNMAKEEQAKDVMRYSSEERTLLAARLSALLQLIDEDRKQQEQFSHMMEEERRRSYMAYWKARADYAASHLGELVDCDADVASMLDSIKLPHLKVLFAKEGVDMVVFANLEEQDLERIGVSSTRDRQKILSAVLDFRADLKKASMKQSEKSLRGKRLSVESVSKLSSAPQPATVAAPVAVAAPDISAQPVHIVSGEDSTCVICMERTLQTVFLPCGHLCTCETCALQVTDCPLCRSAITQRLRVYSAAQ